MFSKNYSLLIDIVIVIESHTQEKPQQVLNEELIFFINILLAIGGELNMY